MKRDDFLFDLPEALIAQKPLDDRSASRLLVLDNDTGQPQDNHFTHILDYITPDDLIVFNDTKVIPARLFGKKPTGGKVEVLVERLLGERSFLAHVRSNHSPKPDTHLIMDGNFELLVKQREGALFLIEAIGDTNILDLLDKNGHIPLPPYIEREDELEDRERYQTVYARNPGAVAAPTAGLHFDADILAQLEQKQVETAYVTLHVGAGTFQPVRENDLSLHEMHAEYVEVSLAVCEAVERCRQRGGRVIAVGTTSMRSLEAASVSGKIEAFSGLTRLFITPGYTFNSVDMLITNFHLPGSTLLMLVSAFSGYEAIMNAYQHAIDHQYRFFSYGDAMLLCRK